MNCKCGAAYTFVASVDPTKGDRVERRRKCVECNTTFTTVEVYAGMNASTHDLQFYDLKEGTKINIYGGDLNGDILFDVDYEVEGENLGTTGVDIYNTTTQRLCTTCWLSWTFCYFINSYVCITKN